jgi:hypothetical protein
MPSEEWDITTNSNLSNSCPAHTVCPAGSTQAITPASGCITDCVGPYIAARSDPGPAIVPIDAWNFCRYIDNAPSSGFSIFVPFNSSLEWVAFINNKPGYINLKTCSRPGVLPVPNDYSTWPDGVTANPWYNPSLFCDTAVENNVNLPYGRTGSTSSSSTTFTCKVAGLCDVVVTTNCGADQTWTLTATATFTAGTAPDNNTTPASGDWTLTSVAYSGTKPTANPAPIAGQCGSAQDSCNAGTYAGDDSNDGTNYYWTCNGANGGTNASCSALMGINGVCGTANGTAWWDTVSPSINLCSAGSASLVNAGPAGNGPWAWTCNGVSGDTTASCSAPNKTVCVTGFAATYCVDFLNNGLNVSNPRINGVTQNTATFAAGDTIGMTPAGAPTDWTPTNGGTAGTMWVVSLTPTRNLVMYNSAFGNPLPVYRYGCDTFVAAGSTSWFANPGDGSPGVEFVDCSGAVTIYHP